MDILYLSTFGKAFIPKKLRPYLRSFFEKTGRDDVPYELFGVLFWVSIAITYTIYILKVYPFLHTINQILFFILTLLSWTGIMLSTIFLIGAFAYFYLNMRIYHRTKEMEGKLGNYLTLVSTSIKGGYSFEKALWGSIKPEFGILSKEIGLVSKKVMTGNDVTEALNEFADKYNSPILKRTISLIVGEVESGGKIAMVIDRVISDLKKTKQLKEELAASTLSYMIFISALVIFVMPLLFALSFVLFTVISHFMQNLAGSVTAGPFSMLNLGKKGVDVGDYKMFSALVITIIGSSSAIIISIIEKGDMKGGVKFIPLFVVTGLLLYFFFLTVFNMLFSGIIFGG